MKNVLMPTRKVNRGADRTRLLRVRCQFESWIVSIANVPGLTAQDVSALSSLLNKTVR
jgi:hypothetical protein